MAVSPYALQKLSHLLAMSAASLCLVSCAPKPQDADVGLGMDASPNTATASDAYPTYAPTSTHTLMTIDGRFMSFYLDIPTEVRDGHKLPLLISVDGSGCTGQLREGSVDLFHPGNAYTTNYRPFVRLMVEKPGVKPTQTYGEECSEEFLRHYSITQRVLDHMQVIQHLRATADWWSGEVLVFGWSDGGDIAAQLVAYHGGVDRAVLGAMGGGLTMAEHFERFWQCPEDMEPTQRVECQNDLGATLDDIRDNPTWTKTWSGQDNSYKVWATRLDSRLSHILRDNTVPILIVQGEEDRFGTPVESARALVSDLEAAGNTAFTYWEIPMMEHGWLQETDAGFTVESGKALEEAMLAWLLEGQASEALKSLSGL